MPIPGTVPVAGLFAPTSLTDTYPVSDTFYGIDGLRNVSSISERNSIPEGRRRVGMLVGVTIGSPEQTIYYKLLPGPWNYDNTDWEELNFSGGASSGTYKTVPNGEEYTNVLNTQALIYGDVNVDGTYIIEEDLTIINGNLNITGDGLVGGSGDIHFIEIYTKGETYSALEIDVLLNDKVDVSIIQTTITDDDSFIPSSGAVVDYVASVFLPAGSDSEIQFNNSGNFGSDQYFKWYNNYTSLTIGYRTGTIGTRSISIGGNSLYSNQAVATNSVAFGIGNIVGTTASVAFGLRNNINSGSYSTVWGSENLINQSYSTIWGTNNEITSNGTLSTVWGENNIANAPRSTIWGTNNQTNGSFSTVFGGNLISNDYFETIIGTYNIQGTGSATNWVNTDNLFTIGNGTSSSRSNAFEIKKSGYTILSNALKLADLSTHSAEDGMIRFDGTNFQGYKDSAWYNLDITAGSGLTLNGDEIELGGTLNRNTDINIDNYILSFTNEYEDFDSEAGLNDVSYFVNVTENNEIFICGRFTQFNGLSQNNILKINYDGSKDTSFDIGIGFSPSYVSTIKFQSDGKLLIAGNFTSYNVNSCNYIARLNTDGSFDSTFNIGTGFQANTKIAYPLSNGKIIVGGWFSSYNGKLCNRLARLNTDGGFDSTFNIGSGFNSVIYSVFEQVDGKILVAGYFTSFNGNTENYLIRLNTDGSKDTTFDIGTGFNNVTRYVFVQSDGKILVGGSFTSFNGNPCNSLARLNTDGSFDSTFNIGTGFNSQIKSIEEQSDGKILVGGSFTSFNGNTENYLIRLNTDGSKDSTFDIGDGFNSTVESLKIDKNNKIVVGGSFTSYDNITFNRIIRLNSDGSISTTLIKLKTNENTFLYEYESNINFLDYFEDNSLITKLYVDTLISEITSDSFTHNNLSGLQGLGTDYYHLNSNQYNNLSLLNVENTFTENQSITKDLTISGNLYVNGTEFITNTETVLVKDNILTLNSGEVGPGVTSLFSGLEIDRGTENPYYFGFDEIRNAFVLGISEIISSPGTIDISTLQVVATREDNPEDSGIAVWNESEKRFDTDNSIQKFKNWINGYLYENGEYVIFNNFIFKLNYSGSPNILESTDFWTEWVLGYWKSTSQIGYSYYLDDVTGDQVITFDNALGNNINGKHYTLSILCWNDTGDVSYSVSNRTQNGFTITPSEQATIEIQVNLRTNI